MRGFSRTAVSVALIAGLLVCTGCFPRTNTETGTSTPGETVSDLQPVVDAVQSADPSATKVVAGVSPSGLSQGLKLEIDHEGDVTSETLAAVLSASVAVEPEVADITLYFFAPGTDDALPIRSAADELGVPWTRVGSGASWLTGQLGGIAP